MQLRSSTRPAGRRSRQVPRVLILVTALALPVHAEQVEMYFVVEHGEEEEIGKNAEAAALAEKATPIVLKRLQAADIHDVQVAQMKHQIRVSLDANAETIDRVKRLVTTVGRLELLIEATDRKGAEDSVPGTRVVRLRRTTNSIKELEMPWIRVEEEPHVDSTHLKSAVAQTGDEGSVLDLLLDDEGKTTLATMTETGVGRELAVVVDGSVISSAVIREPITSGAASIDLHTDWTGSEARDLAAILSSGPLSAPLNLVDEKK